MAKEYIRYQWTYEDRDGKKHVYDSLSKMMIAHALPHWMSDGYLYQRLKRHPWVHHGSAMITRKRIKSNQP